MSGQHSIAGAILQNRVVCIMRIAIHLDSDLRMMTGKIDDKCPEWHLLAKVIAALPQRPNQLPEADFGWSRILPQSLRPRRHRAP